MIRKFLLFASLAGVMFLGISARTQQAPNQPSEKGSQQQAATKSVTGTVSLIGNGGRSFTLDVSDGSNGKRTIEFVLDKNTQVKGQVQKGTPVIVEYQAMDTGQNLAVSVIAQG